VAVAISEGGFRGCDDWLGISLNFLSSAIIYAAKAIECQPKQPYRQI
jgi:hypothetical protein